MLNLKKINNLEYVQKAIFDRLKVLGGLNARQFKQIKIELHILFEAVNRARHEEIKRELKNIIKGV